MSTLIFLGPSLLLEDAQKIMPDAWYHEPVQCGDIIRAFRLNPQRILIIDGYYESRAAVWHKELLLAMDQGIEVFGASSMGALRAAEMAYYGMTGLGKIFQDFHNKTLTDDDEVAVLHTSEQSGYQPINEAMVNIRETIQQARSENIITDQQANNIISHAKNTYYPKRSIKNSCQELSDSSNEDWSELLEWAYAQDNYINLKKNDAIDAIKHLKNTPIKQRQPKSTTFHTTLLRRLSREISYSSFARPYDYLPKTDKNIQHIQHTHPDTFSTLHFLTELLVTASDVSKSYVLDDTAPIDELTPLIEQYKQNPELTHIIHWASSTIKDTPNLQDQIKQHQRWLNLLIKPAVSKEDHRYHLFITVLWLAFETLATTKLLELNQEDVIALIQQFYQERDISTESGLTHWLEENNIKDDFNDFLMSYSYLSIIFMDSNYDFLTEHREVDFVHWLKALTENQH